MAVAAHFPDLIGAFADGERRLRCASPSVDTRLRAALKAYTTRFVAEAIASTDHRCHLLDGAGVVPQPGDVVLARVSAIGKHTRLEGPGSRRQRLFPGREILVAYGSRYASDQFLAEVPDTLAPCHLVAAGGIAGRVIAKHATVAEATEIEPIGIVADHEGVWNLSRFAPLTTGPLAASVPRPAVVGVLGTSMNAGKTTTAACLVNGLVAAGLRVAAGKVTGTGAGNDVHHLSDAGAQRVLDFTDFGHASTFGLSGPAVRDLLLSMISALSAEHADVIVIEVADGAYQQETARLLRDPAFGDSVDHVLFAAQDAFGAVAGTETLRRLGVSVTAVSGLLTASPLGTVEATAVLSVPVIDTYDLCQPAVALEVALGTPLNAPS